MPDENADMKAKLDRVAEDVAGIKALLQSEPQRCAYREQIARAMNNIAERQALAVRVGALETGAQKQVQDTKDALHKFELNAVKILALVGVSGAFGAGAEKLLQAIIG